MSPSLYPDMGPRAFAEPEDKSPEPSPRFRAAWLVALLVAAAWFVGSAAYWQSDDFIALQYASDAGRGFLDFTHNQYGLAGVVWFYRPLITLSWVFDSIVAGINPFWSHLSNVIVHGINAALLGLLVCRFFGGGVAFFAALVWGLAPGHAGAVLWAVGRTGIHCSFWMLLCLLLLVRHLDGRGWKYLFFSLLAAVLAFCSKELACVLPALVILVAFAASPTGNRLRASLLYGLPFVLLLAVYLTLRISLFGRLGGYDSVLPDPVAGVGGLGTWLLRIANPLWTFDFGRQAELFEWALKLPGWARWFGFLPLALGTLLLMLEKRLAALTWLLVACLVCAVPLLPFWVLTENLSDLRLFYLPMMPLAVLLAAGSWRSGILAVLIAVPPLLLIRQDYVNTWERTRSMHNVLRNELTDQREMLNFVSGLDRQNEHYNCLMFHLGVDRLVAPPFSTAPRRVFALRPLSQDSNAHQIPYGEIRRLPFGATWLFTASRTGLGQPGLDGPGGDLKVEYRGPEKISAEVLGKLGALQRGEPVTDVAVPEFVISGFRAKQYRVTVFTAGGYISAFAHDAAPADSKDGRFTLLELGADFARALTVPSVLDLDLRLPVLIEAHEGGGPEVIFTPTHANHRPVYLQLDRTYASAFGQ